MLSLLSKLRFFKKHEQKIENKEVEIAIERSKIHSRINKDLIKQDEVNKVLGNGITLHVYHASHGAKR